MEELLAQLLIHLEIIAEDHGELLDSEVREAIGAAVMDGFVRNKGPESVPEILGMLSDRANQDVHDALVKYVNEANKLAESLGVITFRDRLHAFQNISVMTRDGNTYDDFFGHTEEDFYDADGNVVRLY